MRLSLVLATSFDHVKNCTVLIYKFVVPDELKARF